MRFDEVGGKRCRWNERVDEPLSLFVVSRKFFDFSLQVSQFNFIHELRILPEIITDPSHLIIKLQLDLNPMQVWQESQDEINDRLNR
jgi:hypothetical protein